jgi:hypothetical protein
VCFLLVLWLRQEEHAAHVAAEELRQLEEMSLQRRRQAEADARMRLEARAMAAAGDDEQV